MSNPGALISPRLVARIHHTLGRASNASPEQAVLYGEELIQAIQLELEKVHSIASTGRFEIPQVKDRQKVRDL